MPAPSLLERVVAALFGATPGDKHDADRQLVLDIIEMVVETVEPRLRLHRRYRAKLQGCVRTTVAWLRSHADDPPDCVLLSRAAWSADPRVNAFFATPDEVAACLGRSRELRAFFADPANAGVEEAFALLGMKKKERTVFAPKLEGEILKHDVAQVSVSFSAHRILAPAASLASARAEVGRRILRRLAQVALARIMALDSKATELRQHTAYLGARMRLLNLARDGMEGIVQDPATINQQVRAVKRELKDTVDGYIEAKSSLATLDGYIEQIDAVFSHPEQYLAFSHTPLRLTRMGLKVNEPSPEVVNELVLVEVAVGENERGAVALVRCPRSELRPQENLVANAERHL